MTAPEVPFTVDADLDLDEAAALSALPARPLPAVGYA